MDRERAERVLVLFEKRGELELVSSAGPEAAEACLARARDRIVAAELLLRANLWESAFTNAYDAYRIAAESIVLALGYRVPAVAGAHRITIDIARAAVGDHADVFAVATAERFRTGRHDAEYFDPDRPRVGEIRFRIDFSNFKAFADAFLAGELDIAHRSVVVCRHLLGWSVSETASALRIREGTVKSRLHRATRILQARLHHLDPTKSNET